MVAHRYHVNERRSWILQLYLMFHVVTPMLIESLDMSLNEKLGIPFVITPSVRKSRNVVNTIRSDAGIHRSTHAKYPIDRLRYDGFSALHYAWQGQGSRRTIANLL